MNFVKEDLVLRKRIFGWKNEKYVGKLVRKCGNWRKCGFEEKGAKMCKNVKLVKIGIFENWNILDSMLYNVV